MEIGPEFPSGSTPRRRSSASSSGSHRARSASTPPSTGSRSPRRAPLPLRQGFSYHHLEANGLDPDVARTADLLRSAPHFAFHVRRGDSMNAHFDTGGWHARQSITSMRSAPSSSPSWDQ